MRINIEDVVVHDNGREKPSFIFRPSLKDLLEELGTYKVDCGKCQRNNKPIEDFCNYCMWQGAGINYYKERTR